MEEYKSKVYVKIDDQNRITRCEGGYTMQNIDDISVWTYIDEGDGDRYNLCQNNYFAKPLYEEHGIPRYKYENGEIVERTQEEIEADIADIPLPEPTEMEQLRADVDFLLMMEG